MVVESTRALLCKHQQMIHFQVSPQMGYNLYHVDKNPFPLFRLHRKCQVVLAIFFQFEEFLEKLPLNCVQHYEFPLE